MKKAIKYYTCRKCKINFSHTIRQGRDPQYCSDGCRGQNADKTPRPTIWNLTCKCCNKEWSMERVKNSGRKPHFCPECHGDASKKRHLKRLKERDRSYASTRNDYEEKMVKWLPAEPLLKVLLQSHVKNEDWAIVDSRDRSTITYMAARLGIEYSSMRRYVEPNAKINAYKGDEFAIRLRIASHAYLGNGFL